MSEFTPKSLPTMIRKTETSAQSPPYTCREYRGAMILLALQKRISQADISSEEREVLKKEIVRLEEEIDL